MLRAPEDISPSSRSNPNNNRYYLEKICPKYDNNPISATVSKLTSCTYLREDDKYRSLYVEDGSPAEKGEWP